MPDRWKVDCQILGPLVIEGPAGPARIAGPKRRTLVGSMLLRPGELLSRTQLIEAMWDDDPPSTVVKTLHSHIAVVRRALESIGLGGVLVTKESGYALDVPLESVDAQQFEDEVRRARNEVVRGDHHAGIVGFQAALGLWRGDVLAGSRPEGWAAAETAHLQELRICATEELWSAELAQGNHVEAAQELARLTVIHPLREQIWELLMLSLYRCGRRAESLQAYERLKALLRSELRVDPGPRVTRLRRLMLTGSVR